MLMAMSEPGTCSYGTGSNVYSGPETLCIHLYYIVDL